MRITSRSTSTSMKSIMQVASFSPPHSGNFIASLRAAAAECKKNGFKLVWVFPEAAQTTEWFKQFRADPEASVYVLPTRAGHIENALTLTRIARKENAAIIHTHFSHYDISAWLAKVICALELRRVELIWHVHSAFPDRPNRARLAKDFFKLGLMGRLCHLVAVWEPLRDSVVMRGCPGDRVHVVPNGVDIAHATQKTKSPAEVRRELNIPDGSIMLLGFGWTPIRKGVDTMIEALDSLLRDGIKAVLVLVGTDELKRFVEDWPQPSPKSAIRVIPGTEYVSDLYGATDVFISASRAEGFPYAVVEAMVNDVFIASTDIPALSWATHAPGISFFQTGDSYALAETIRRITDRSEGDRRETAGLSTKFVCDRYTVQRWAQSIASLYQKWLPLEASAAKSHDGC